ncbi:MAG: LysR family transcriptional regulator [Myxococcota bacterium]
MNTKPERPLDGLDLNLLLTLRALLHHASVSQAAHALGSTQPTVSRGLAQLRLAFGDPLLVRTGRGMALTPVAKAMVEPLERALGHVDRLRGTAHFDPATDRRIFGVILPDVVSVGVLSALQEDLVRAPETSLEVRGFAGDAVAMLLSGGVDVVVGATPLQHADFYSTKLGGHAGWSVLVGSAHPAYGSARLTKARWLGSRHVQLVPGRSGARRGDVEAFLDRKGLKRRVQVRIGYLLGLAELVASTELVATLPTPTARALASGGELKAFAHPLRDLPKLGVRLTWHATQHQDAGQRWFRERLAERVGAFLRS